MAGKTLCNKNWDDARNKQEYFGQRHPGAVNIRQTAFAECCCNLNDFPVKNQGNDFLFGQKTVEKNPQ